jgi:hypothetical protein
MEPELGAQYKRPSINGYTLLCMYLAEHFSGCLVLQRHTVHQPQSTFDAKESNNSTEWQTYMSIDNPHSKWDLTYANATLHKSSEYKFVVCGNMYAGKHSTYMWLVSYAHTSVSFIAQYYIQQHHHLCKLRSDCAISRYKLHVVPIKSMKVIYIMCVISGFYRSINESLLCWVVKQHRLIVQYAKTLLKTLLC